MTTDQYHELIEHGILDKVELIDGRITMGDYDLVLNPAQAAAAKALGVPVWTCVDAVLEDPASLAELQRRLAGGD